MAQVTNPLSVKTKVHAPKSPSALLHPLERDKVFLEVHIQNMTQETMWFDRMEFECAEGWRAFDANRLPGPSSPDDDTQSLQPLFSGSMALMQPRAVRQYIYILSPSSVPTFPVTHPPGAVIPLGRLDISWRSKFGEPGRLLTSVSAVSPPSLVHACVYAHACLRAPTDALAQNSGPTTATSTGTIAAPQCYPTLPPTRTTRNPLHSIPTTLTPASTIPAQLTSLRHVEIQLAIPPPSPTRNTDPQPAPSVPRTLYLVGQATTIAYHPRARLGSGRRPRRRATCWGCGPGGETLYARTQAERRGHDLARSTSAGSFCRATSHGSAGVRSRSERVRDRCSEQSDTLPSSVACAYLADPYAGADQRRRRTSARVVAPETGRCWKRPTVITPTTLFRDTRRIEECKTAWMLVPRSIRNPVRFHRPHTA
jgi:hypothetical protein